MADDAEIQEAFNYFDRDRDGKISTSELGHLMRSLGRAPTEAEVQEYIKSDADPNGNGFFDLEGLKEVMRKSFKDPKDEEDAILDAFKVFDKDNTGKIAVEELRHVFLTLGETLSKEEVDQVLSLAKPDAQQRIDYKEFMKVLLPQPLPKYPREVDLKQ